MDAEKVRALYSQLAHAEAKAKRSPDADSLRMVLAIRQQIDAERRSGSSVAHIGRRA